MAIIVLGRHIVVLECHVDMFTFLLREILIKTEYPFTGGRFITISV